jgi:hypothetical protein
MISYVTKQEKVKSSLTRQISDSQGEVLFEFR